MVAGVSREPRPCDLCCALHDGIDWRKSARGRREGVGFCAPIPIYFSFPRPLTPPPKKRASIPSIPQKGIDESGGFRFFSVKFQMVELFSGIDGIDGTEFRKVSILHEGCGSEVGLSRRFDFSIPSIP
jgi:hypothetical protein